MFLEGRMGKVFLVLHSNHLQPPRGFKFVAETPEYPIRFTVKRPDIFVRVVEPVAESLRVFSAMEKKFGCKIGRGDDLAVEEDDIILIVSPWTRKANGDRMCLSNTLEYSTAHLSMMGFAIEGRRVVRKAARCRTTASPLC